MKVGILSLFLNLHRLPNELIIGDFKNKINVGEFCINIIGQMILL